MPFIRIDTSTTTTEQGRMTLIVVENISHIVCTFGPNAQRAKVSMTNGECLEFENYEAELFIERFYSLCALDRSEER